MRTHRTPAILSVIAATALAACASAAAPAATTAPVSTPTPSLAPTVAAATYSPKAIGFASTVLIERKRNIGTSAPSYVRIAPIGVTDTGAITATVSDAESYGASYRAVADRNLAPLGTIYESADLPPLAAGIYVEGLRLVVVQPAGQSVAHKHSGIEVVVVLDGTVLIRTSTAAPATLQRGQGFFILPNVPIQLINTGGTVARTLVYSITGDGLPFSTELPTSP